MQSEQNNKHHQQNRESKAKHFLHLLQNTPSLIFYLSKSSVSKRSLLFMLCPESIGLQTEQPLQSSIKTTSLTCE